MPKKNNKKKKLFSLSYRYVFNDEERDDIVRPCYLISESYLGALKKIISLMENKIKSDGKEEYVKKLTDIEICDLTKIDTELYIDE